MSEYDDKEKRSEEESSSTGGSTPQQNQENSVNFKESDGFAQQEQKQENKAGTADSHEAWNRSQDGQQNQGAPGQYWQSGWGNSNGGQHSQQPGSTGGWNQTPGGYQQPPYRNQNQQPNYGGGWGQPNGPQYGSQHPYNEKDDYKWNFEDYENADRSGKPKAKKSKGLLIFASLLGVVLVVSMVTFAGYSIYSYLNNTATTPDSSPSSSTAQLPGLDIKDKPEESTPVATDGKMTAQQVAQTVSPSVVGVANYQNNGSFTPASEGSGIIMTADGYIVTNAHVVEDAAGITVILENGESYAAQLVGSDSKTDLAVLKIEANNLSYATFGNSDQVEVGEDVIAIGNPGGMQLAGSVTKGIVSALNRSVSDNSYGTPYIQTDAAINPGNSGGALVNMYGQVIGINSAKLVATDYEGIGFAIPINDAMPIIEELIQYGRVTGRAALGLTGTVVDETVAMYSGVPTGIAIVSIDPESDLAQKNVAPGDIITKVEGEPITSFKSLTDVVAQHVPGDTIQLTIYRRNASGGGGRTFDVNVKLIEDSGD